MLTSPSPRRVICSYDNFNPDCQSSSWYRLATEFPLYSRVAVAVLSGKDEYGKLSAAQHGRANDEV
jgi:hypothetical protein